MALHQRIVVTARGFDQSPAFSVVLALSSRLFDVLTPR